MKKLSADKRIVYTLIIVCLFQLVISLIWGSKKSFLFLDEVFSYASANNLDKRTTEFPIEQWQDREWYDAYMTVDENHRFDYSIPYKNQISDVHPPLFYFFLYTSCSFMPGRFSYWAGIGWNIAFFIGCTLVLYLLGKEVFRSKTYGVLIAFLFSISYGGLNTMVFIRMYMLMTLILLLHVFVYVRYMELEQIPLKAYIFLLLTLIAGAMTHYYFFIAAFFCGVWYTVRFLFQKRYLDLVRYLGTIILSAAISISLYPAMLTHIFRGGRGVEARENFLLAEGYFSKLRSMLSVMDSQMFNKMLLPIIAAIVLLFLGGIKRKTWIDFSQRKAGFIVFVCMGYFLLVTKVAPYQMDRYLMPIYPLVYLAVIGYLWKLSLKYVSPKIMIVLCMVGLGGLSGIHFIHSGLAYTFERSTMERREIAEKYAGSYVLYIEEEKPLYKNYDIMQVLKNYKGFYCVIDTDNAEKIRKDMEILDNEPNVVLYLDHTYTMEEVSGFLSLLLPEASLPETILLNQDSDWDVYLLKNQ